MKKPNYNLEKANRIIARQTAREHARYYANECIAATGSTVKEWNPYFITEVVHKIAETPAYRRRGESMLKILERLSKKIKIDFSKFKKRK